MCSSSRRSPGDRCTASRSRRWLEQRSSGRLDVTDAALIQALHRLEARGLLSAEWGESKNGRRARYYKLTATGKAHLRTESAALIDYVRRADDGAHDEVRA